MAPTDPRFLATTPEEMLIENWAWFYHEKPNVQEDEDEDFDLDAVIAANDEPENWEPV